MPAKKTAKPKIAKKKTAKRKIAKGDILHIAYPDGKLYHFHQKQNKKTKKKAVNHLLWGDKCEILGPVVKETRRSKKGNKTVEFFQVRARNDEGWVARDRLQKDPILEVNFVDVGQGDGCHIHMPTGKALVIDAGQGYNMYNFLCWRYNDFKKKFKFKNFIISHPDKDHYYGFKYLFGGKNKNISVEKIFHNSIVVYNKKIKFVDTWEDLNKIVKNQRGRNYYLDVMKKATNVCKPGNIRSLKVDINNKNPQYLPGFGPQNNNGITMRLLAPVPEKKNRKQILPRFTKNHGKTKNGNSIVILLEVKNTQTNTSVKMFFGGDLNTSSQKWLMKTYKGQNPFCADIAKACHHGAQDVDSTFLRMINPLASIISSGDRELHCHPRPETLGIIGKTSRGEKPMIFSTELARPNIRRPEEFQNALIKKIDAQEKIMEDASSSAKQKEVAKKNYNDHVRALRKAIVDYGMITVLTDGDKVAIAQRLDGEPGGERWYVAKLERSKKGQLFVK